MKFLATTTFGLEAVLRKELKSLSLWYEAVGDGYVSFSGEETAMCVSNIWLRTADKVFLELASFPARSFEELFEGVFALPWSDFIAEENAFPVMVKSYKSQLSSTPACQSIVKKAIVKKLQTKYQQDVFPEDAATVEIHVWVRNDEVKVLLNTSGVGLHKRGYRPEAGDAPLKETLAAGLVYLSGWKGDTPLYDPFCGTGTILIEAAMIANNIAPGLQRSFAFESWPWSNVSLIESVRAEAQAKQLAASVALYGSDSDASVLELARQSTSRAKVNNINFEELNILSGPDPFQLRTANSELTIITNPPYGLRLGDSQEVGAIYRQLSQYSHQYTQTSWHILTAFPDLERTFGKQAKRRKLYNGGIQCYLYSYALETDKN